MRRFHTQRAPGSAFTFVIQSDSHLDTNTDVRVYRQTLGNMLEKRPDFMVDLGDTTMVDKFGRLFMKAELQYLAQRYHLGSIAHSTPIFLVAGFVGGFAVGAVGAAQLIRRALRQFEASDAADRAARLAQRRAESGEEEPR